ncbi:hypothetical protein M0805_006815 [Coniferiporia weirii]|nr:hypothetical protein M0805_006815 [Coniferiporia weirii]
MSATIAEISGKYFDYVTAGLTIAARLATNPNTTVAVLEAGLNRMDDPLIKIPAQYGMQSGDPRYDWAFKTTAQVHANGRTFDWPRGKLLGGSSGINYSVWTNPPTQDINNWEKLGNHGWNWARFMTYLKKAETFMPPNPQDAVQNRQVFNPASHGFMGPLKTTLPSPIMAGEVPFQDTLIKAGIKVAKDPPIGTTMVPSTVDAKTYTRSYAATASYAPNAKKPNFRVLCDALVHRVVMKEPTSPAPVVADGVEFEYNGTIHTVHATKEVILSAGALKSPQILELSGIGDRNVLNLLRVKPIIELPGVGANMQEHVLGSVVFELDPKLKYVTFDTQSNDPPEDGKFNRIFLSGYSYVPLPSVTSKEVAQKLVAAQRKSVEDRIKQGTLPAGRKEQWLMQLEEFEKETGADVEIIFFPGYYGGAPADETAKGRTFVSVIYGANHLFSRGTVHASTTNPKVQPIIDPHYLEEELDLNVMVETVKFIRTLRNVEPFKNMLLGEVVPGPDCTTDEQIKNFIRGDISTICHTASTLSMLPKEQNGVVDANLRVYGTKNLRVADLSIVPLHISAHCQAAVYSIGEQAADIILGQIPEVK